tara:strand:+ start:1664 stop:2611 length:948 start_codon:yes stop_codon:yes gene_type:complete
MATTTAQINELYADVVADLIPYYDDAVLLPNPSLIVNSYNLSGAIGNQMKIPLTNVYPDGNTSVSDNADLINDGFNFNPTSVTLSVNKKSAGSTISEEALEDGGMDTVRNALVTRLSRSIAQATDVEGMRVMLSGGTSALTDISGINVSNDGNANTEITTADLAVVFSNEAMGYAIKRDPSVKMFNDIQNDNHDFVATLRNGFAQIRSNFIRAVATQSGVGSSTASLAQFSKSVANLRAQNAPADVGGFYYAVITPAQELKLASELNGVGGIAGGAIAGISQDLANQALLEGLIGQAVGLRFVRSNNLPSGIASA